jgi:hypothetical protein
VALFEAESRYLTAEPCGNSWQFGWIATKNRSLSLPIRHAAPAGVAVPAATSSNSADDVLGKDGRPSAKATVATVMPKLKISHAMCEARCAMI